MTPDELRKLTPEQKRIKIAEACGWQVEGLQMFKGDPPYRWKPLPDYLSNLNAMAEARMHLTLEQDKVYGHKLAGVVMGLDRRRHRS